MPFWLTHVRTFKVLFHWRLPLVRCIYVHMVLILHLTGRTALLMAIDNENLEMVRLPFLNWDCYQHPEIESLKCILIFLSLWLSRSWLPSLWSLITIILILMKIKFRSSCCWRTKWRQKTPSCTPSMRNMLRPLRFSFVFFLYYHFFFVFSFVFVLYFVLWWVLATFDSLWQLLITSGNLWQPFWQLVAAFDAFWQLLANNGNKKKVEV